MLKSVISVAELKAWSVPTLNRVNISDITANGEGTGGDGGVVMSMQSDIRLKNDIQLIGQSAKGVKLYSFRYNSDLDTVWIGAMAQDLLQDRPDAVSVDENGFYRVDYSRLDVTMMRLDEWNQNIVLPALKEKTVH